MYGSYQPESEMTVQAVTVHSSTVPLNVTLELLVVVVANPAGGESEVVVLYNWGGGDLHQCCLHR
jgi:hypothetical protein